MTIDPHKPASADESGVRELYRELPQPQPSAELDQAILLAARQALQNDKVVQLPPRPWHKRLLLPLSIAATVVLSFGVVLRLSHEQAAQVVQLQHADILQTQEQAAAPPPPQAESAAPLAATPAPQAKALAPQVESAAPQAESKAALKDSAPAAAITLPVAPPVLPKPAQPQAQPSTALSLPAEQKAAPAAAATDAAASEPIRAPAAPAVAPAPQAPAPAAVTVGGEASGRVADRAANGIAAGVPSAAPAPAAPMAVRKALRAQETVAIDPAINEIRRLLASGERDKARVALLRYRAANPGIELPADLRALLDETVAPAIAPQ